MSELSDNLQNATREALDAINELNVVVREQIDRIAYLEQQLEAERRTSMDFKAMCQCGTPDLDRSGLICRRCERFKRKATEIKS